MPSNFWSKIFVESQDLRSDAAEVAHEEIVLAMVEQIERNRFSNKFDDFQVLIEGLKNQSLMAIQHFERFEAQMVEQAKVRVKHAKVMTKQAKVMAEQAKGQGNGAKTTNSIISETFGGNLMSYGRNKTTQTKSCFWTYKATI